MGHHLYDEHCDAADTRHSDTDSDPDSDPDPGLANYLKKYRHTMAEKS